MKRFDLPASLSSDKPGFAKVLSFGPDRFFHKKPAPSNHSAVITSGFHRSKKNKISTTTGIKKRAGRKTEISKQMAELCEIDFRSGAMTHGFHSAVLRRRAGQCGEMLSDSMSGQHNQRVEKSAVPMPDGTRILEYPDATVPTGAFTGFSMFTQQTTTACMPQKEKK